MFLDDLGNRHTAACVANLLELIGAAGGEPTLVYSMFMLA